jgi:hypothetical protein
MKHFFRSNMAPADAIAAADDFFLEMGFSRQESAARSRTFAGDLGVVRISARPEGGHYTFVEAHTDQIGESRLDRNVKRFFLALHRISDPRHKLEAAY